MAYNKLIDLNLLSNFLSKIKSLIPTKTSDLENDSEYITGMEILSYGNSTWNDFLTAYTAKKVVYCRASSNSNPASGSQTRLAFMAYVNNADNPTNVEFQYYRSVSSHTSTQQGDQVFVYKLDKTSGWSVITREASSKVVAGTNMTSSYSNNTVTLNASIPSNVSDLTNDSGYITGITSSDVTTALGYTPSSTDTTYSAGNGIDITNTIIKNTQGIEYIVGTQITSTAAWTGNSTDETLYIGKIIAYYLPFAGTSTAATLTLTMKNGATTEAIRLLRVGSNTITTQFAANNVIILIYDGTYWRVSAYYDSDTNTVPTGYCATGASTAAKSATCTYGYRDDTNYFPCLFRYANTAANATLAIASYGTTALPIYVNGERTSATNTFGRGVILFLYYDGAYYCYNDGRLPILVDGVVTSVQDYTNELKNTISEISQVITSTDIDSTPIATFDASVADMPLKGLTVNIEPVQAEGTPSPENPLPITGWTGVNVFDDPKYAFPINWNQIRTDTSQSRTVDGITTKYDPQTHLFTITNNSRTTNFGSGSTQCTVSSVDPIPGHRYALLGPYHSGVCVSTVNDNNTLRTTANVGSIMTMNASTATMFRLRITSSYDFVSAHPVGDVYSFYLNIVDITQLLGEEAAETATYDQIAEMFPNDWYPYNAGEITCVSAVNGDPHRKISVNWEDEAGTVYGGTFDVVNRKLNSYPYYSSYNGETIIGPWISSMDVYALGATPTLGAQVVDMGGAATSYDLSDVPEITTFLGTNNIWADTGDITVTYGAYLETVKSYTDQLNNNIPNTSSISNTGLISIKHDSTELFTIQLPLYNGGVSNGT